MAPTRKQSRTRKDVILDAWNELSADSAGGRELQAVQQKLQETLGEGGVESPAGIARTLADHGVRLRHPEVLKFDSRWRELRLYGLLSPEELDFRTLANATAAVTGLDSLNRQFEFEGDTQGVQQLHELVRQVKSELQQVSISQEVSSETRQLATEVLDWLTIWLQNPLIFEEWLSLRRASSEFARKFGGRS